MLNARALHTATLLPGGKVLVVGGATGLNLPSDLIATTELYDPESKEWRSAGTLSEPRAQHTATLMGNGKVLIAGGFGGSGGPLDTVMIYDPENGGSWSSGAAMNHPRFDHDAVWLPSVGRVLVVGGGGASQNTGLLAAELYDPVANRWTSGGSLSYGRKGVAVTLLSGDRVLAVGGSQPSPEAKERTSEVYQGSPGAWTLLGASSATKRVGHTVTRLNGGEVLVVGGDLSVSSDIASPERISESNLGQGWRPAGTLNKKRVRHTATLLKASGDVLVTGGSQGTEQSLNTVEIYRSSEGTWKPGPALSVERAYHQATLLDSGEVLITGGLRNRDPAALESAVVYTP